MLGLTNLQAAANSQHFHVWYLLTERLLRKECMCPLSLDPYKFLLQVVFLDPSWWLIQRALRVWQSWWAQRPAQNLPCPKFWGLEDHCCLWSFWGGTAAVHAWQRVPRPQISKRKHSCIQSQWLAVLWSESSCILPWMEVTSAPHLCMLWSSLLRRLTE